MITILHGENIAKSRLSLESLKKEKSGREIVVLSGEQLNLPQLKQVLESRSLFGQDRLVILENIVSAKKSKEKDEMLAQLKIAEGQSEIVIWEGREATRANLGLFPKASVKVFKLDPVLFQFLETVKPGKTQAMIESFRKALLQEEIGLIFYMLIRQFRLMFFLANGGQSDLEETERMASWQRAKLVSQGREFRKEELLAIYRQLLEIDWREKNGTATFPLNQTLELFLSNL